jgi:hypothetical protein
VEKKLYDKAIICGICAGQLGNETHFSWVFLFSPDSIPHQPMWN